MIKVYVSVGELVDKITILDIKSNKIRDPSKLVSIEKERAVLGQVASEHLIDLALEDVVQLKEVNLALWDIEDRIREKERQKDFGSEFVQLARSVYLMNDRRFQLKSLINDRYHSELREEKSYEDYSV